jgi:hypothetical protein
MRQAILRSHPFPAGDDLRIPKLREDDDGLFHIVQESLEKSGHSVGGAIHVISQEDRRGRELLSVGDYHLRIADRNVIPSAGEEWNEAPYRFAIIVREEEYWGDVRPQLTGPGIFRHRGPTLARHVPGSNAAGVL